MIETLPPAKPWYESKILWLGVLVTLQSVLPMLATWKTFPTWPQIVEALTGVIIVIVRVWFTDMPVNQPFLKR